MTYLPVIVACAFISNGEKCGAWAEPQFFKDEALCEHTLQESMTTLLEAAHQKGGYVYWIKGSCMVVDRGREG